jgi:hypothetical protein
MKSARCCFYLSFIVAIMILSAELSVENIPSFNVEIQHRGTLSNDGAGLFIGCDDALSNRDIIVSDSSAIDGVLFFHVKRAVCLLSQVASKLSRNTSAVFGSASVRVKVYIARYLVSVSEGGKNVKNIPSNIKNWQYAVDPAHLEIT